MKKIVLWGAEFYGQSVYHKMKAQFEIICFVDNSIMLTGEKRFGIPVISAEALKDIYSSEMDIVICERAYFQISTQLIEMGIHEYYVMMEGFLYHSSADEAMMPVELSAYPFVKKEEGENSILFVQTTVNKRTNEIAAIMKEAGYKVYLLSMLMPQEGKDSDFTGIYDGKFTFYTADGIIEFIENSDFDIVHSIGPPFVLANIVLNTSKHIILTADQARVEYETVENFFLEYVAVTRSSGIMCGSQQEADGLKRKYGLRDKNIISLDSNISVNQLIEFYKK